MLPAGNSFCGFTAVLLNHTTQCAHCVNTNYLALLTDRVAGGSLSRALKVAFWVAPNVIRQHLQRAASLFPRGSCPFFPRGSSFVYLSHLTVIAVFLPD